MSVKLIAIIFLLLVAAILTGFSCYEQNGGFRSKITYRSIGLFAFFSSSVLFGIFSTAPIEDLYFFSTLVLWMVLVISSCRYFKHKTIIS